MSTNARQGTSYVHTKNNAHTPKREAGGGWGGGHVTKTGGKREKCLSNAENNGTPSQTTAKVYSVRPAGLGHRGVSSTLGGGGCSGGCASSTSQASPQPLLLPPLLPPQGTPSMPLSSYAPSERSGVEVSTINPSPPYPRHPYHYHFHMSQAFPPETKTSPLPARAGNLPANHRPTFSARAAVLRHRRVSQTLGGKRSEWMVRSPSISQPSPANHCHCHRRLLPPRKKPLPFALEGLRTPLQASSPAGYWHIQQNHTKAPRRGCRRCRCCQENIKSDT